jgi:Zn-finger nucleic acid-binding protein
MNCPKCPKETMIKEVYEGVEVDRCPTCKGIFFDKGELKTLIDKKMGNTADTLNFSSTSDQMDKMPAFCSRCNRDMAVAKGPGTVRVDVCQQCGGAFLDQGELATLQLYYP